MAMAAAASAAAFSVLLSKTGVRSADPVVVALAVSLLTAALLADALVAPTGDDSGLRLKPNMSWSSLSS
jgi:hypothetical protein